MGKQTPPRLPEDSEGEVTQHTYASPASSQETFGDIAANTMFRLRCEQPDALSPSTLGWALAHKSSSVPESVSALLAHKSGRCAAVGSANPRPVGPLDTSLSFTPFASSGIGSGFGEVSRE